MQLYCKGDVLEFRDQSQWEIIGLDWEEAIREYIYEIENIKTGEFKLEVESSLNNTSHIAMFSNRLDQQRKPLAKVYNLADYRQKRISKKYGVGQ